MSQDTTSRPGEPEPETHPPLPTPALILITLSLALAVFMNVLDISITNVSIPTIAGNLGVASHQGTWIITSFAVANAVAVPVSGWMTKRVGEVKLFVVCTALFTLASFLAVSPPVSTFCWRCARSRALWPGS